MPYQPRDTWKSCAVRKLESICGVKSGYTETHHTSYNMLNRFIGFAVCRGGSSLVIKGLSFSIKQELTRRPCKASETGYPNQALELPVELNTSLVAKWLNVSKFERFVRYWWTCLASHLKNRYSFLLPGGTTDTVNTG